ncbi:hypothetical protein DIPPA_08468 [Diplonema papillatum]|nr:hypothetical protein DIPPA_08468 [Diplonema papillatum]
MLKGVQLMTELVDELIGKIVLLREQETGSNQMFSHIVHTVFELLTNKALLLEHDGSYRLKTSVFEVKGMFGARKKLFRRVQVLASVVQPRLSARYQKSLNETKRFSDYLPSTDGQSTLKPGLYETKGECEGCRKQKMLVAASGLCSKCTEVSDEDWNSNKTSFAPKRSTAKQAAAQMGTSSSCWSDDDDTDSLPQKTKEARYQEVKEQIQNELRFDNRSQEALKWAESSLEAYGVNGSALEHAESNILGDIATYKDAEDFEKAATLENALWIIRDYLNNTFSAEPRVESVQEALAGFGTVKMGKKNKKKK